MLRAVLSTNLWFWATFLSISSTVSESVCLWVSIVDMTAFSSAHLFLKSSRFFFIWFRFCSTSWERLEKKNEYIHLYINSKNYTDKYFFAVNGNMPVYDWRILWPGASRSLTRNQQFLRRSECLRSLLSDFQVKRLKIGTCSAEHTHRKDKWTPNQSRDSLHSAIRASMDTFNSIVFQFNSSLFPFLQTTSFFSPMAEVVQIWGDII